MPEVPESRVYVLVTMRSEFLGDCATFYQLAEKINAGTFLLPKMSREQLSEAILGPLEKYQVEMNPALLHEMLDQTIAMPEDSLPLLQHALRRMWDNRSGDLSRPLDLSDFQPSKELREKYGEKRPALQILLDAHLDEILENQVPKAIHLATARFFCLLGEFDVKGRLIRRPTRDGEARAVAYREKPATSETERQANREKLQTILKAFLAPDEGRPFLRREPVRAREIKNSGETRIEVSHEVILRQWTALGKWLVEERARGNEYQRLSEQANQYPKKQARLNGRSLRRAQDWFVETAAKNHSSASICRSSWRSTRSRG